MKKKIYVNPFNINEHVFTKKINHYYPKETCTYEKKIDPFLSYTSMYLREREKKTKK